MPWASGPIQNAWAECKFSGRVKMLWPEWKCSRLSENAWTQVKMFQAEWKCFGQSENVPGWVKMLGPKLKTFQQVRAVAKDTLGFLDRQDSLLCILNAFIGGITSGDRLTIRNWWRQCNNERLCYCLQKLWTAWLIVFHNIKFWGNHSIQKLRGLVLILVYLA